MHACMYTDSDRNLTKTLPGSVLQTTHSKTTECSRNKTLLSWAVFCRQSDTTEHTTMHVSQLCM